MAGWIEKISSACHEYLVEQDLLGIVICLCIKCAFQLIILSADRTSSRSAWTTCFNMKLVGDLFCKRKPDMVNSDEPQARDTNFIPKVATLSVFTK